MKYLIAVLLSLTFTATAQAHEWAADEWAKRQVVLTERLVTCSEIISESFDLFIKECSDYHMTLRSAMIQNSMIIRAMQHHPATGSVRDFIASDFKNKTLASDAIKSVYTMTGALVIIGDAVERHMQEKKDLHDAI